MATYMSPETMPHGMAVLVMRRDEAEALACHLAAEYRRGAITSNTDLYDVTDAINGLDNVYTVTDEGRAALKAAAR
jgi:hypothetical protein